MKCVYSLCLRCISFWTYIISFSSKYIAKKRWYIVFDDEKNYLNNTKTSSSISTPSPHHYRPRPRHRLATVKPTDSKANPNHMKIKTINSRKRKGNTVYEKSFIISIICLPAKQLLEFECEKSSEEKWIFFFVQLNSTQCKYTKYFPNWKTSLKYKTNNLPIINMIIFTIRIHVSRYLSHLLLWSVATWPEGGKRWLLHEIFNLNTILESCWL